MYFGFDPLLSLGDDRHREGVALSAHVAAGFGDDFESRFWREKLVKYRVELGGDAFECHAVAVHSGPTASDIQQVEGEALFLPFVEYLSREIQSRDPSFGVIAAIYYLSRQLISQYIIVNKNKKKRRTYPLPTWKLMPIKFILSSLHLSIRAKDSVKLAPNFVPIQK